MNARSFGVQHKHGREEDKTAASRMAGGSLLTTSRRFQHLEPLARAFTYIYKVSGFLPRDIHSPRCNRL